MSNASMRHVATAGLAATATIACPTQAMAATASADPMPYVNFALGCVTGAAITSSVALVLAMRDRSGADGAVHSATSARATGHAAGDVRHAPNTLGDRGVRVQSVDDLAVGSGMLGDYSDVATSYVRGQGVAGQMAARAVGVRDTLLARLGGDFFDDLPIIERADGTVGDVGTSWWDARLASQTYRGPALVENEVASADASGTHVSESTVFMAPLGADANTTLDMGRRRLGRGHVSAEAMAPRIRSAYIASKVAEVDNGTFPERRSPTDLDEMDAFDRALAAMDERMGKRTVPAVFVGNAVSAVASVDEERLSNNEPTDEVDGETSQNQVEPQPMGDVVVSDVSRVDEVLSYPALPIIDADSSGSFLRVIPGGQAKQRTSATDRVRQGLARHFRREAIAL